MLAPLAEAMQRRSHGVVAFFDLRMETLISGWIAVMLLLGVLKVCIAPQEGQSWAQTLAMLLPFLAAAGAPVIGYRAAAGTYPRGHISSQPLVRLCRYGSWKPVDGATARRSAAYGPAGFMASLIAGILLNVPFRTIEFMLSMPAIPAGSPHWAGVMITTMTIDIVVMNFIYMVCFVMALRSVPLFPRMLVFAWIADISLQFAIADNITAAPGLPLPVATALLHLLEGNVEKVLISAFVWLPYLILSDRVNLTFRQRVRSR